MSKKVEGQKVTIERLEWALDRVALAIHKAGADGPTYLPIFERLERELLSLRQQQSVMSSVQARLQRMAVR